MEYYKQQFIEFLLESDALKLHNPNDPEGLFTLKSGRRSPFFMNMGELNDGEQLVNLGAAYAEAIHEHFKTDFDVVFGPAYKGIPLAVSTAMQFNNMFKTNVRYCADRKEVKDHGDVGGLVGAKLKDGDRIVIVEDVTTSGKSIEETMPKIRAAADVEVLGLIVSFDRMEVASEGADKTAIETVSEKYGIETSAIVSISDVLTYMQEHQQLPIGTKQAFVDYYEQYGVKGRRVI